VSEKTCYESRRITISYLAVYELCQMFDIPQDAPTQAFSAAIEKLIFQSGVNNSALPKTQNTAPISAPSQPNKAMLTSMASQFKGVAS
jgi:hypothetical protein